VGQHQLIGIAFSDLVKKQSRICSESEAITNQFSNQSMASVTDMPRTVASSVPRDHGQAHEKPYFLSLDLSSDKMGLIIVDESLDVIFGECVKFDTDLPEYGTQNGCHTDGEVSTSPIHLHVKALDLLLQKVSSQVELKRVKCIGGSAQQHKSVWWSKAASTLLSRLTPSKPLHEQLPPEQTWTLPNPPNFYDMSTDAQAQSLEWHIGGSEETARRSGVRAFCRFTGSFEIPRSRSAIVNHSASILVEVASVIGYASQSCPDNESQANKPKYSGSHRPYIIGIIFLIFLVLRRDRAIE